MFVWFGFGVFLVVVVVFSVFTSVVCSFDYVYFIRCLLITCFSLNLCNIQKKSTSSLQLSNNILTRIIKASEANYTGKYLTKRVANYSYKMA